MKLGFKRVKDLLTGSAGLAGVGSLIELTKLKQRLKQTHLKVNPRPDISHGDVATSYLGLLCQGKPDLIILKRYGTMNGFFLSRTEKSSIQSNLASTIGSGSTA